MNDAQKGKAPGAPRASAPRANGPHSHELALAGAGRAAAGAGGLPGLSVAQSGCHVRADRVVVVHCAAVRQAHLGHALGEANTWIELGELSRGLRGRKIADSQHGRCSSSVDAAGEFAAVGSAAAGLAADPPLGDGRLETGPARPQCLRGARDGEQRRSGRAG
eukprot:scaffold754_cov248-Pinguiococcus_pyrenoidosus.AAC.54